MARSKKLYILLGVLIVICVITLIVSHTEEKKEEIKNSEETILAIPADDVNSISWETEDVSFAFHRDGTWIYDADENFPTDEEKMNELLGIFADFGVSFIIENVEDFSQYGLDDPVGKITLETADQTVTVELGGYSTMDSERYVSIGDGNVYLVSTDPYDSFNIELSAMIDNDEIPDVTGASEIVYTAEESGDVIYDENLESDCADDVYYLESGSTKLPLDTDNVSSYLRKLYYLSLSDYVTYNASSDDLVSYGLSSPELSLVISYTDEDGVAQMMELSIGRDEDQKAAAETESDDDSETTDSYDDTSSDSSAGGYLRVGQSKIVYALSASDYASLTAISYDSLRHKDVFTADFSGVEKMNITLDGEDYTILASGDTDSRTYTYLDNEIDVTSVKSALTALSADSFTDEQPTGKQELGLTLYVTTGEDSESTITINLYRYDGEYCIAEINGEPVSLVSRSSVTDLIEAIYAIVLN
jgi:hypothetical protein